MVSKKYGIQYFGQCKDISTPFFISEAKINNYSKKNRTVILKVDLNQTIAPEITKLNIWRCANIENPDTCEHYMKDFVVKGICEKINAGSEDQIWVNAFKYVTPELKCPLAPAQYVSKFQLDISESLLLRIVPFPPGFWKLRGISYENGEMVACADLTFKVNRVYK
ncbi:uncharacterized protein LOC123678933 isoform X2 [Harmonia axyridis]|uniref:uncharacterized protein LOC123678933 isoform X2 n=1 Tax=Harmonia axyridis TaxID=115357 RepID=UPI001E275784|nr:uncharacterized protein LOC123678933 isoform X2 [Harmonia axyridis]